MKILLTMAGLGSRFKEAGYSEEKYDIVFRGHRLLEWSLASLCNFRHCDLIFIARELPSIRETIRGAVENVGFIKHEVVLLESTTRGQAETAIFAEPLFREDDSILIFNTDTFIEPQALTPNLIRGDGWIPTFSAPGDKWSFVEALNDGLAVRTAEKVRISDHCSVGLYYFSSFSEFADLARKSSWENEQYVAPLYNKWIAAGHKTYIHELDETAVTVLGTPEDLEAASAANRPIWPESCRQFN